MAGLADKLRQLLSAGSPAPPGPGKEGALVRRGDGGHPGRAGRIRTRNRLLNRRRRRLSSQLLSKARKDRP